MHRICAILAGPFASSPFAHGLRMLLADSGRFEVIDAAEHGEVAELVATDRPVVVISEGMDVGWSLALLDHAPNASVVLLDDAGRRAVLAVGDPGAERLVRVIEDVAAFGDEGSASPASARLRLIGPDDELDADVRSGVVGAEGAPDLRAVVEWLELVLGQALARRAAQSSEPSVAGWSTSPMEALRALGFDDASAEDLGERLRPTDRSLVVDRTDLPPVITDVARTFELTDAELRALLLTLAPELDGRFGVAFGVLHDDLSRRRPSLTLIDELDELGGEPVGAWRRRQELEAAGSLLDRRLVVPDRRDPTVPVVDAGLHPLPASVAALVAASIPTAIRATGGTLLPIADHAAATVGERRWADRFGAAVAAAGPTALVRVADPETRWFERVAPATGLPLVDGDLRSVPGDQAIDLALADWLFLAAISGAGLVVRGVGDLAAGDQRRLAEVVRAYDGTVGVVATDAPCPALDEERAAIVVRRPRTDIDERAAWWAAAAGSRGLALSDSDATALASTMPLEPREIDDLVDGFVAQPRDPDGPVATQLRRHAVDRRRDVLPATVRSVATRFTWDDLVLADPAMRELRSISTHLLLAGPVLDRWGFGDRLSYGRGVTALFAGASGTGKTMAAQILAAELGVELLLVDLSQTVSKYLGETEKNVDEAFRAGERRGALLLFDEADALFGKRSEVKDAHDRHANVEIAYLLQRMEAFEGIAILTSNLKQNIDDAFLRRLRFVVDFPMPDAAEREAIWRRSFPAGAPLDDDIDFGFLGRRLDLTGGTIQQVALHAAFTAAGDDGIIGMHHVVAATKRELDKLGMFDAGRALDARTARVGAA